MLSHRFHCSEKACCSSTAYLLLIHSWKINNLWWCSHLCVTTTIKLLFTGDAASPALSWWYSGKWSQSRWNQFRKINTKVPWKCLCLNLASSFHLQPWPALYDCCWVETCICLCVCVCVCVCVCACACACVCVCACVHVCGQAQMVCEQPLRLQVSGFVFWEAVDLKHKPIFMLCLRRDAGVNWCRIQEKNLTLRYIVCERDKRRPALVCRGHFLTLLLFSAFESPFAICPWNSI